ncbi:hypothetical protein RHSIM_Rhsim12G0019500 [Rhododendron simsii]|uniref:Protein TIFY n=1 Tax=Rhododendron simsii TaxID=118357 RepID=A0A834G5N7_RHOSS|nr:hypothetical protein RHSIM_Rhsim12G0019500 [Rhododendron simsii]
MVPNNEIPPLNVCDLFQDGVNSWDEEKIEALFSREVGSAIRMMPISWTRKQDALVWGHTFSGLYSVKSGYHLAFHLIQRKNRGQDSLATNLYIQGVISKMNPELLKSVIGSVELKSNAGKFSENGDALTLNPSSLKHHESVFPPAFGGNTCGLGSFTTETTPLTIFYNGTVAVFDVPRPRAENILKLAVSSRNDLPIARRKSLQRFLEKRKERLNLVSRYGCPADGTKLSVQKSTRYCRL